MTSVSGTSEQLQDAAAAAFVLTHDDLKPTGATGIPDALRNVPGLHVARIDTRRWVMSARGFNGRFANKPVVLMDGRQHRRPGATFSFMLPIGPGAQPKSLRSFANRDAELLVVGSHDARAQNVQQHLRNWQARPKLAQNMAMARLHCKAATQRGGFVAIVVNHEHPGRHAAAGQTTPTVRTVQRCA